MTTRNTIDPDLLRNVLDQDASALPIAQVSAAAVISKAAVLHASAALADDLAATRAELSEVQVAEIQPNPLFEQDHMVSDSLLTPLDDGSTGS